MNPPKFLSRMNKGLTGKTEVPGNAQGGFIQIIVTVILLLFIMKLLGLTISELWHWFTSFFSDVLR